MRFLTLLFLLFSLPAFAQNGEVNQLTPNNIGKNTLSLTPEMQQKFIGQLQNMTPQQKQAITDQAKSAWQSMSQENKDAIKAKAMEQWQSMTPEQKQQMQNQAIQKWQSLSPQEKQQMTSQFKGLLQGGLQ